MRFWWRERNSCDIMEEMEDAGRREVVKQDDIRIVRPDFRIQEK